MKLIHKNMEKVCIVMSSLTSGGAEKMVTYITNMLSMEKKDVTLILFKKEGENLKYLDSRISIISLDKNLGIIGIAKLIKILLKKKPEIIFISLGPLNAIFSLFLFLFKKTKVIARETNIPSIIFEIKKKEKKIYVLINIIYRMSYRFYDLIIAQSNDMKKDLIENFNIPEIKIKKISNLIDIERIEKLKELEEEKELQICFDNKNIYGIALGRLVKQKGFDLLIESVKKLKGSNIIIYILGEGSEKYILDKKIREYGLEKNIKLLGFKENPYIYLKRADFFILPSRVEGFPNSLIEALACGLPSIVNNCSGGINEIIISNFNGEIVDFENTDLDLRELIEKILKYDKKSITIDTIQKYDKNKILAQYLEIFN